MNKLFKTLIAIALLLTCTPTKCNHVHDENCGYDPKTGEGCTHTCEFIETHDYKDPDEKK